MVYISGGMLRGRRLQVPNEPWIRPTMGLIRHSLFQLLQPHLAESRVLDLFAGCGLLGLEALSRGAKEVFFVDLQRKAVQSIEKNVTLCGVRNRCTLLQGNLSHEETWHKICHEASTIAHPAAPVKENGFDLVLMDPPYRQGWIPVILHRLQQSNLLSPGAVIATEQEAQEEPPSSTPWRLLDNRRYGDTRIVLWQQPPAPTIP
ncbi:MAG: 16S rRNA (guanine(966)-N(2))-methyltransferase RsmD [Magnetococcales bacterium]|nr:16S rRNA (guanine(966)-N(2))-methyltransferase RsmD [Magnetococcales bacterium]